MIKRAIVITAWLVAGHAVLGAMYWGVLLIPESNVLMLGASLFTFLAMIAWGGAVQAVALRWWGPAAPGASAAGAGMRRAGWFIPALAVFAACWLVTGYVIDWLPAHAGEVDAWIIAKTGWTGTAPLHAAAGWAVWFLRYGVGVSLAAACMAAGTITGASAVFGFHWLRRGLSWQTLLITTAALLAGFVYPWHRFVDWRPASLPATWAQPAFAAAKLGVLFVIMNAAWAVVLWWAARGPSDRAGQLPARSEAADELRQPRQDHLDRHGNEHHAHQPFAGDEPPIAQQVPQPAGDGDDDAGRGPGEHQRQ